MRKITPQQARAILDELADGRNADPISKNLKQAVQALVQKAETIVPMLGPAGQDDTQAALTDATMALQAKTPPVAGSPAPGDDAIARDMPAGGEQPTVGPQDFLGYIYGAILDEVKAVSIYEALKTVAPDEATRTVLEHIRQEEVQHIEELKHIVASIQRLTEGNTEPKVMSLGRRPNEV